MSCALGIVAVPICGKAGSVIVIRLAEFERELIRARTGEGRSRAKALGEKMGRPPKMTSHQVK
jgi:DNA invertase Pin-like site-specific DNA recombinase